jgi:hypothetical protein
MKQELIRIETARGVVHLTKDQAAAKGLPPQPLEPEQVEGVKKSPKQKKD